MMQPCEDAAIRHTCQDDILMVMLQQEASCYSSSSSSSSSFRTNKKKRRSHRRVTTMPQQQEESAFCHAMGVLQDIFHLVSIEHHETLVIAASYLSRYLNSSCGSRCESRPTIPLLALMCFYMAVKVHEPAAIALNSVCHDLYERFFETAADDDQTALHTLTGSSVTLARLEQLELDICQVLQWRLHPPTPLAFVRCLLAVAEVEDVDDCAEAAARVVLERAFSMNPWAFCRQYRASILARAALELTTSCTRTSISHDRETRLELARAVAFLRDYNRSSRSNDVCSLTEEQSPVRAPPTPLQLPTTLSPLRLATTTGLLRRRHSSTKKRCVSPLMKWPGPGSCEDDDVAFEGIKETPTAVSYHGRCHKRRRKDPSINFGGATSTTIGIGSIMTTTTTRTTTSLWVRPRSVFSAKASTLLKRTLRSPRSALSVA